MTDPNEVKLPAWEEYHYITDNYYGTVLDAGCSNGEYTVRLKNLPRVIEVYSVDIQPKGIRHHGISFSENVPSWGKFYQADVQDMPFADNFFDCILCWDMFQNVRDSLKALKEFHRVVKNNGLVSIRTNVKSLIPWVVPGVTPETGSSGYTFINYTIWDPEDLVYNAENVGFEIIGDVHIDEWNHMNGFFKAIKKNE